jgi:multidrug resistance efflux pump
MENTITKETDSNQLTNGANRKKQLMILAVVGLIIAGVIVAMYLYLSRNLIYVEKSQVLATQIDLGSANGGKLEQIFVSPGDSVTENQNVAQIGNEIIKTKVSGTIINTSTEIGKVFTPGEAVVSMIQPADLKVVVQVEEDKGLKDISVGDRAYFTVDAFGAKKYWGIVDEISPTYRQGDVVFNISSQRQVNEFDVKIRFDINQYPELKNGMSAKAWIIKD